MTDLDRLVRESLRKAGDGYQPDNPVDARLRFMQRVNRRRILVGASYALAGAAAIILIGFFLTSLPNDTERSTIAGPLGVRITSRAVVGANPGGVARLGDSVWVANEGDGTITRVITRTGESEEIEVGGAPDELESGGTALWVADATAGSLQRVGSADGDLVGPPIEVPGARGGPISIAAGSRSVWVASRGGVARVATASGQLLPLQTDLQQPSVVTLGEGSAWALDTDADAVAQIDQTTGNTLGSLALEVDIGSAADLAVGGGGIWIADLDAGSLYRFDQTGGVPTDEIPISGNEAHLEIDERGLWVATARGPRGQLQLIDLGLGERIGEPLELPGRPSGIASNDGTIWIVDKDDLALLTITAGSPSPSTSAVPGTALEPNEIVFVFQRGGDLFARTAGAHVRSLIESPEIERNPTFLDGDTLLFERLDATRTLDPELVTLDLVTGVEQSLGVTGSDVSVGSNGEVALEQTRGPGNDEQSRLQVGPSLDVLTSFFVANPGFERVTLDGPSWDPSGRRVYYEAGVRTPELYYADVDLGDGSSASKIRVGTPRPVNPSETGGVYVAPAPAAPGRLGVVKMCCFEDGRFQTAELGELRVGDSGEATYRPLVNLDDMGLAPEPGDVSLDYAGMIDVEVEPGGAVWRNGSSPAWIVGQGGGLWLVDADGEVDRIDVVGGGVAVNPVLVR